MTRMKTQNLKKNFNDTQSTADAEEVQETNGNNEGYIEEYIYNCLKYL